MEEFGAASLPAANQASRFADCLARRAHEPGPRYLDLDPAKGPIVNSNGQPPRKLNSDAGYDDMTIGYRW
jgi:hypothetical protein